MLDSRNSDPDFMNNIITGDESWVYGYAPEIKSLSSRKRGMKDGRKEKTKKRKNEGKKDRTREDRTNKGIKYEGKKKGERKIEG